MQAPRALKRLLSWEYFWLCLVVVATLIMHLLTITISAEPVFDEHYYVGDAVTIINAHQTQRTEHPPLAKLFIVAGMEMFGNNPWGWRFFSVLVGTAMIVLFYFLCRRLDMTRNAASIAVYFLGFETLSFAGASVAMLDVFYVAFMIASFLLYASRRYIASGVVMGLSMLCKFTAVMALPALGLYWLFSRRRRTWRGALALAIAPLSFVVLMPLFDFAIVRNFSNLQNPLKEIATMWHVGASLTFASMTNSFASRPWEWLLSYKGLGDGASISYAVLALAIPTFAYLVYRAVKRDEAGLLGSAWFASTYVAWIPLSLITDRISYIYYFYPAIGSICLGVGLGASQLIGIYQKRRSGLLKWTALVISILVISAQIVSFLVLLPMFSPVTIGVVS